MWNFWWCSNLLLVDRGGEQASWRVCTRDCQELYYQLRQDLDIRQNTVSPLYSTDFFPLAMRSISSAARTLFKKCSSTNSINSTNSCRKHYKIMQTNGHLESKSYQSESPSHRFRKLCRRTMRTSNQRRQRWRLLSKNNVLMSKVSKTRFPLWFDLQF